MNRKEEALRIFECGFNCSQAVLSVFCEEFNCDKELALKIATGFGGGMRKGEVCGAVTGAIMVLGLKCGHYKEGDTEAKNKAYALTKEFINRFENKNGTIVCKKLLGYDLSIPEEYELLTEKGMFKSMCPKFIEDAISILEEL
jgi:C_GCAxxG_C_C family probable redox protein